MLPPLTTAQQLTFKNDVNNDASFNNLPHNTDGAFAISAAYNVLVSPDFWAYRKTPVPLWEVGNGIDFNEMANLTTADSTRLQNIFITSNQGIDGSIQNRRDAFNNIFSGTGGANTRAALDPVWRRKVTRVEKLYTTGTGSTGSPAQMATQGPITTNEVMAAMGW